MKGPFTIPETGQIVRVRSRRYLVEETVSPPNGGDSTLVRLSCVDDDAQGQALDVLWEKELAPEVLTGEGWAKLGERGFDPPDLFAAYFHTLRWNCLTATNPRLFQSPFRAGIKIDAYQLEPLRKALLLPRVNLFIADDVGLGKTIEAGLIARELLLRKKVKSIVVACPPSMLLQWQDELEQRFGLTFAILDRGYIASVRQERGYGVNPWTTHSRFLVSQKLLIDEAYVGPMRAWLGELQPGSLLILDEAHHAAPASGAKYAIDSKITRAIRDIAQRFEHRLFPSATPHNGHSNSFSALLELLDPQRFCRGVPVTSRKLLEPVMVRRLKEDLRQIAGGFPKRIVNQVDIEGLPEDAPELKLAKLLDQYRLLREERLASESKRKRAAAGLLVCGLQQRLLSSVEAFARTLKVHRKTVLRQWEEQRKGGKPVETTSGQIDLLDGGIGADDERAELSEEDLRAEEEIQFERASEIAAGPMQGDLFKQELALLDQMETIAEKGRYEPDGKVRHLVKWIRSNLCPDGKWNHNRIIIFTEWDDTKRYLVKQLSEAFAGTDQAEKRIKVYHGPTPAPVREDLKRAFNTHPSKDPLRILICTDAAREGLNLQAHCWNLFHFDVPWNPSRMEQRNGRIDRKLQPKPEVYCHYFVYQQRPEDRVLKVLVRKTKTIKEELGSLSQVVEGRLSSLLKGGIRRADIDRMEREIDSADLETEKKSLVQTELEESRERQDELKQQIDRLRTVLGESKNWIGLEEAHLRSAISCSLELLGAKRLKQMDRTAEWDNRDLQRFAFPQLDQRQGADMSWADTLDTLRRPRKRDEKIWDWRKEAVARPVVFEDTGAVDDSVVHLHLEHRVVQRLLGRFRSQGFVHNDLSRACLAQTSDTIPRVVLIGRLCIYGPNAARLHEELIPVSARWIDPAQRKGGLRPYGKEAHAKTLELLEEAISKGATKGPGDTIKKRLQESAPGDIDELVPFLTAAGEELADEVTEKLKERSEIEASAMREILESQKVRIAETEAMYQVPQLELDFDIEEKKQLDSNRRHWKKRLDSIKDELQREPARIRQVYSVRAKRIEPVGLVYLWPVTG